jgi:hypothetical protein
MYPAFSTMICFLLQNVHFSQTLCKLVSDLYIPFIMRFHFTIFALAASALAHPEPVQAETETNELTGNTFLLVTVNSLSLLPHLRNLYRSALI